MADPVGIVGASVAGLALACGLAAHGVRSVVLDRRLPETLDPEPVMLGPRALEALARWGLAAKVRHRARCLRRLRVCYQGAPRFDLKTSGLPTRQDFLASLDLGSLRQMLGRHALGTGLVEMRRPARVVGIQGREGRVRILLEGGSTAGFHLLAAACPDLRRFLGIRLVEVPPSGPCWSGLAGPGPQDDMVLFLGASGVACAHPREAGQGAATATAWTTGVDLPTFREHLGLPGDWVLREEPVPTPAGSAATLVVGPVVLLGSAARSLPEVAWRSRDADILEAEALVWRLAAVARGAAPGLLAGYDAEIRPRTLARATLATTWLPRLCHPDLARLLGPFLQSRLLRRYLTGTLGSLVGTCLPSAWCLDERPERRRSTPRPGMRLPEVSYRDASGHPCWLHDLLGTRPLVLRFGEGPALAGWRVSRQGPGPGVLHDAEGLLERSLRGRPGEVMIVRPDGVIGYRAWPEDPQRTEAWLASLEGL